MRDHGQRGPSARLLHTAAPLLALALVACGRSEPDAAQPDLTAAVTAPPPPATPPRTQTATTLKPAAAAGEDWNDQQIDWKSYDAGMALAKSSNKPVCLVLFTGWCPHCKNYSRVFSDPRVVAKARDFVMIRLNADDNEDVARKYAPDGGYVPRTFFVAPDGTLAADVHAPRPKYLYFWDESDPSSLLGGMDAMQKKLAVR